MNRYLRLHDPAYTDNRPQEFKDLLVLDRPDQAGQIGVLMGWKDGAKRPLLHLKLLGKGSFKCAYLEVDAEGNQKPNSKVVIVVSDLRPDWNMACFEFINRSTSSVHVPKVSLLGFTNQEAVYAMPRYITPLPSGTEAYNQFKEIEGCWEEAQEYLDLTARTNEDYWHFIYQGDAIREMTVECVAVHADRYKDRIPASVMRGLNLIEDACRQIGDASTLSFDFHGDNFATDDRHRLIFLDPLLDLEVLNFPQDYAEKEGYSSDDAVIRMACVDRGKPWF